MVRKLQVAVRVVGPLEPSKMNDYPFRRITLKNVGDETDKTDYRLNLNKKPNDQSYANWMKFMEPGAVYEVTMQDGRNKNCVNQWVTPKLIKKAHEAPKLAKKIDNTKEVKSNETYKVSLAIQVQNLQSQINEMQSIINTIVEDHEL